MVILLPGENLLVVQRQPVGYIERVFPFRYDNHIHIIPAARRFGGPDDLRRSQRGGSAQEEHRQQKNESCFFHGTPFFHLTR